MKLPDIIKDIDVDKAIKLSIIGSMLLISFSFFYYYVIFLPSKERTRMGQEKQEQIVKELKEQEAKDEAERKARLSTLLLNACFGDARANYEANWANSCKTEAQKVSTGYQNCINSGLSASSCKSIWGTADASADCSLSTAIAQRWDEAYQKAKDECFKKYPQK